ncbi:unnamed protein product [Paramecium octaurelia]|uniref:Uncharacterized protein n=1 Tax=Paramecium octaurelia TaxID=43137 RepID=A0A8S1TTE8_PAROT|nr:unnamed protein product [Paramecium octaurelia]
MIEDGHQECQENDAVQGRKEVVPDRTLRNQHLPSRVTMKTLSPLSVQFEHLWKGQYEGPNYKTLFIGGSRPKQDETEKDLMFRRLLSCLMGKQDRSYGMKELLKIKMKEIGVETEVIESGQMLSHGYHTDIYAEDLDNQGFVKTIPEFINAKLVIHRWDQFPNRNSKIIGTLGEKKTFHLIQDDMEMLHHVLLHGSQIQLLETYYLDRNQQRIQLINKDWPQFISMARGRNKLMITSTKKSRDNSVESQRVKQIFQVLEESKFKEQLQILAKYIGGGMSDQDSVRSQFMVKRLRIDQQVFSSIWRAKRNSKRLNEENIARLVLINTSKKDAFFLIGQIFPEGLSKFVEQYGLNNYLKLFLKLTHDYLKLSLVRDDFNYMIQKITYMTQIKRQMIKKMKFIELENCDTSSVQELVQDQVGILDKCL